MNDDNIMRAAICTEDYRPDVFATLDWKNVPRPQVVERMDYDKIFDLFHVENTYAGAPPPQHPAHYFWPSVEVDEGVAGRLGRLLGRRMEDVVVPGDVLVVVHNSFFALLPDGTRWQDVRHLYGSVTPKICVFHEWTQDEEGMEYMIVLDEDNHEDEIDPKDVVINVTARKVAKAVLTIAEAWMRYRHAKREFAAIIMQRLFLHKFYKPGNRGGSRAIEDCKARWRERQIMSVEALY